MIKGRLVAFDMLLRRRGTRSATTRCQLLHAKQLLCIKNVIVVILLSVYD